jgi:hypothetical protein
VDRFDHIFTLHEILGSRSTPLSRRDSQCKLECSCAAVGRLIEEARDFLGGPVHFNRCKGGDYYERSQTPFYELPG